MRDPGSERSGGARTSPVGRCLSLASENGGEIVALYRAAHGFMGVAKEGTRDRACIAAGPHESIPLYADEEVQVSVRPRCAGADRLRHLSARHDSSLVKPSSPSSVSN